MDTSRVIGLNRKILPQKLLNQFNFHQAKVLSVQTLTNPKIREWFEYLYNETDPEHSKYRCGVCHRYAEQYSVSSQLKTIAIELKTLKLKLKKSRALPRPKIWLQWFQCCAL